MMTALVARATETHSTRRAPPGGSIAWSALDGGTHRPTLAIFRRLWDAVSVSSRASCLCRSSCLPG